MIGWSRLPMSPEKTSFVVAPFSVTHISMLDEPSRWPTSTKRMTMPGASSISFIVIIAPEQRDGCLGVLNGVHGFHRLCTGALAFAVLPLGFEFLDVRRVAQHDAAQFCRGPGGVDPAPEAVAHQKRQKARVVDMGMGGQHAVDLARCNRDGLVLIDILALFHTTVDEVALSRRFQEGTTAGHFVVSTQNVSFIDTPPTGLPNFGTLSISRFAL